MRFNVPQKRMVGGQGKKCRGHFCPDNARKGCAEPVIRAKPSQIDVPKVWCLEQPENAVGKRRK